MRIPIVGHVLSSLVRKPGVAPRGKKARDERVRDALQDAPVGIGVATRDGQWLFINERFRKAVGYTRDELARLSLEALTHPEDARKELTLIKALIRRDIDSYRVEKRVMAKDGRYRAMEVLTSIARDEDDVDLLVHIIDEPQAPKRLEPDRVLATIIDRLVDVAVIRTDERGVITGWNAGAERVFGYKRDEIVGRNRRTLFRDRDSWDAKSTKTLQAANSTKKLEMEDWRVTKDGRHIWIRSCLFPYMPDNTMKGYVETIVAPPPPASPIDTSPVVEQLRAELEKRRGAEESLRGALDDLGRTAKETMAELRIMTAALRDEIARRKAAEEELRRVNAKLAAAPEPPPAMQEEIIESAPPKRAWHVLEGSFADVIRTFAGRTGMLLVAHEEREKEIFFEDGLIFSCASNDPDKFLTQRLLEEGVITEEQRQKAIEIKQASQLALGRILLILGAIDEQQLVDAMRTKVEDEIADLLAWREGRYAFVDGEVPSLQLVPLRIDPAALLDVPVYVASARSGKVHKEDCLSAKRIAGASRVVVTSLQGYERCRICFR